MSLRNLQHLYARRGARAHFGRPFDPASAGHVATLRIIPQASSGPGVWVHDLKMTPLIGGSQQLYFRLRAVAGAPTLLDTGGAGAPSALAPRVEISDTDDGQTFTIAQVFLGTLPASEVTGIDPIIPRGADPSAFGGPTDVGWWDTYPYRIEWFVPIGSLLDVYPSTANQIIHSFVHVSGVDPWIGSS